jgi:hypothetical protein
VLLRRRPHTMPQRSRRQIAEPGSVLVLTAFPYDTTGGSSSRACHTCQLVPPTTCNAIKAPSRPPDASDSPASHPACNSTLDLLFIFCSLLSLVSSSPSSPLLLPPTLSSNHHHHTALPFLSLLFECAHRRRCIRIPHPFRSTWSRFRVEKVSFASLRASCAFVARKHDCQSAQQRHPYHCFRLKTVFHQSFTWTPTW